jgi:hypothetical protein
MKIAVSLAVGKDVPYIDHLQRKNAEELSFYPKCVFEREIESGRILLAKVNGQHAGYLYHGAFGVSLKIHQACIEYDLRGQAYGAQLVRSLEGTADLYQSSEITLRCGSDIAANGFWKAMGFACVAVTPGGVRRMRDINNWCKSLQPALFPKTSVEPSTKAQDSSVWRKRTTSIDSQFLRGKALIDYRLAVLAEQNQDGN